MSFLPENAPNAPERLTMNRLWEDVLQAFDIERGVLYTFFMLKVRPYWTVRTYLFEDRTRLTNPFKFLAISITLSAIVLFNTDLFKNAIIEDAKLEQDLSQKELNEKFVHATYQLINDTYAFSYMLIIPILALFSWLFFPRRILFLGEHVVIHSYLSASWNLVTVLFSPLLYFYPQTFTFLVILVMAGNFIYVLIVYRHFGSWSWGRAMIYAMLSYGIGMIIASVLYWLLILGGAAWQVARAS